MKVKVRVALAVDSSGEWCASGWKAEPCADEPMDYVADDLGEEVAYYWLTAEVDTPESQEVVAEVQRRE